MDSCHILVVEDDQDINRLVCRVLEGAGWQCRPAFSGSEGLLWAERYDYDLVVLDLMLPGVSGEEFIAQVRRSSTMPIIVLSAKAGVEARVEVLRLGADDFVPKPFDNQELLARAEAQLRRYKEFSDRGDSRGPLTWGPLELDREEHRVTAGGKRLTLTGREFAILEKLMERPGHVLTRGQIYESVWGEEFMGDDNTVNVHVSNLRAKLARAGVAEAIRTVWGIGFTLGGEERAGAGPRGL